MAAGAGAAAPPATAQAAEYVVTSSSESSPSAPFPGTLRRAVSDANAHPGPDNIVFSSSLSGSTIIMHIGIPLEITEAVTIEGLGSRDLAITGFNRSRIFTIDPSTPGDEVTISGLELLQGYSASSGGAILNQDAKLTIRDCWFLDNASGATGTAGGALADAGEYADGAQTTIEGSTFEQNEAPNGSGGAVGAVSQLGKVVNSTFADNYAYDDGGALFANGGGGTLQNVTIAHNDAAGNGGGLALEPGGPNISLENSIVGPNTAAGAGADLSGTDPIDAEFSLIGDTSGLTVNETVADSNLLDVDPGLQNTQGPTNNGDGPPTLKPDLDSPVVDQGRSAGGVVSDERGDLRPVDLPDIANSAATGAEGADMGAVELSTIETTPEDLALSIADTPDPATVGDPLSYVFRVDNNGPNEATDVEVEGVLPPQVLFSTLSGNCQVTGNDPFYGTYIFCHLGDIASGAFQAQSLTVTPQAGATAFPYITAYGFATAVQVDPDTYDNFAYADTVVRNRPATPAPVITPPQRNDSGMAAAIKRCKKKFQGKARKKCVKRVKGSRPLRARVFKVLGD